MGNSIVLKSGGGKAVSTEQKTKPKCLSPCSSNSSCVFDFPPKICTYFAAVCRADRTHSALQQEVDNNKEAAKRRDRELADLKKQVYTNEKRAPV